jgi:hypothetical protein
MRANRECNPDHALVFFAAAKRAGQLGIQLTRIWNGFGNRHATPGAFCMAMLHICRWSWNRGQTPQFCQFGILLKKIIPLRKQTRCGQQCLS